MKHRKPADTFFLLLLLAALLFASSCRSRQQVSDAEILVLGDSAAALGCDEPELIDCVFYDAGPVVEYLAQPEYPQAAKEAKLEGTVWVKMHITKSGSVCRAVVVKTTNSLFNRVALMAAMKCHFKPAVLRKQPASASVAYPFKFRLR